MMPVSPGRRVGDGIFAVVVTFNPDRERFQRLWRLLPVQVERTIVVDNGSDSEIIGWLDALVSSAPESELVKLGSNRGIAAAQNQGMAKARGYGCHRILLMDHDSLPAPDMVTRLLEALMQLQSLGLPVAAVGPRYRDSRQDNPPPFLRVRAGRVERIPCPSADTVNEVDYLIASGSLIPMATLDRVGLMDEGLFIDYVDIEWGMRARQLGFLSYGVCAAVMDHDLGEEPFRFLGRALPSHSATRHYYLFRNAVHLYRRSALPRGWKLVDGYRLALRYLFYSVFAKPRLHHQHAMLQGLWHGILGRQGSRESASGTARSTRKTGA